MRVQASQVAAATNGELIGPDIVLVGASIDSRAVEAGALFVPIVAERDGHEFIASAIEHGAGAYLTARPDELSGGTAIVVGDTSRALTDLGRAARERLSPPVVGITGSVGKTSTKDLAAAACSAGKRTHANPASFNNELGLPLTLLNAPDDTEVTILEMGARGAGHISELCDIASPTIGVVTRVALAHGEQFGSIEGVAEAKGELVERLPADGRAVLNAGDERVLAMASRTSASVLTYGVETGDVAVRDLELDEALRPRFVLATPAGSIEVHLAVRGAHMAENAAGAVAVALAVGVGLDDAVRGLEAAQLSAGRMDVRRNSEGALIINDAYNANPTSVRAGLAALDEVVAANKVAVLGVMAELGPDADALHRQIADEAVGLGFRLLAVAAPAYGPAAEHVSDSDTARRLLGQLGPEDAVLVKGSLVAGLQTLAESLLGE